MATLSDFYHGARPKTLSAALSPVLIGAALALAYHNDHPVVRPTPCENVNGCVILTVVPDANTVSHPHFYIAVTLCCFVVAIALQIGVNYANDYSDGIKGTDAQRVGPMRLVGSGRASARSVIIAMFACFVVAGAAGVYVASQSSWWLVLVGVICIALAWFYTGSKHPYGYYGLGELAVFVCFGPVATVGTYYANTHFVTRNAIIAGCIPGLYSVAILLANNIRDIATDKEAGKKTLAVRIGDRRARHLFAVCFIGVACAIIAIDIAFPVKFFAFSLILYGLVLTAQMYEARRPPEYISILVQTSSLNLVSAVLIAGLIVIGPA